MVLDNMVNNKSQKKDLKQLKVALVCDWISDNGGAERVMLELHKMFPKAPIYTSQYDSRKVDWFKNAEVRTGWLQKFPISLKKFLPVFRAWYFSHLDLSEYDLIISDSGAEAKGVRFGPNTTHICICNAPTHYYWSRYEQYLQHPGFSRGSNWLAKFGLRILIRPLRHWDKKAAQRPTHLIAISSHIQAEIKKYYSRESSVIFPPVDTERFKDLKSKTKHGFVIVGRQTPYKRFDLAVLACSQLGVPLKVVGNGPENAHLKYISGPSVEFTGVVSEKVKKELIADARAFIFPGLDDFGIAPIEALAAGTPVIAFKGGGALEYVQPGINGLFFNKQSVESLKHVLHDFANHQFKTSMVKNSVKKFSNQSFADSIQAFIKDNV
jgi:glycosyltransferase involved in cell wall biosynthesis